MKITVTFDSLGEFLACMKVQEGFDETPVAVNSFDQAMDSVQKLAAEGFTEATDVPFDEEPKENPPKQEKPAEEPAAAVTEDFRADVRKALAKLNKQTGQNTAAEIIKAAGYKRLTEVPLEKLPAIMDKAKEALDA